jgi:hypothetical protein
MQVIPGDKVVRVFAELVGGQRAGDVLDAFGLKNSSRILCRPNTRSRVDLALPAAGLACLQSRASTGAS